MSLTYLGIQLDTVRPTISVPSKNIQEILDEFLVSSDRKHATKRELLSLVGILSFATKCIPGGRIFLDVC